jgi:peroxiredoxin
MARTPSTMLELGTSAPDFDLLEPATGQKRSLSDFSGSRALLVAFICNHCPYVIHIIREFVALTGEYADQGLQVVAINANDVDNYADDSPEKMIQFATDNGFHFPYLYDESQQTAKDYQAACTPDFYLFDADGKLVWRGQFDDARPRNDEPVTGEDMRAALEAILNNRTIPSEQKPSMGCNIKWKPGNEPAYYG